VSRLMSVSHTKEQVRARTKTETRRLGWWKDKTGRQLVKVGDTLTLCEKVMGRRHACTACDPGHYCGTCCGFGYVVDPLVRICDVTVTDVRRERLCDITAEGVAAEGFPDWSPGEFVSFFCDTFGTHDATLLTVLAWEYL